MLYLDMSHKTIRPCKHYPNIRVWWVGGGQGAGLSIDASVGKGTEDERYEH